MFAPFIGREEALEGKLKAWVVQHASFCLVGRRASISVSILEVGIRRRSLSNLP